MIFGSALDLDLKRRILLNLRKPLPSLFGDIRRIPSLMVREDLTSNIDQSDVNPLRLIRHAECLCQVALGGLHQRKRKEGRVRAVRENGASDDQGRR